MYYNKGQTEAPVINFFSRLISDMMNRGDRGDRGSGEMDRINQRHKLNMERDSARDAASLAQIKERARLRGGRETAEKQDVGVPFDDLKQELGGLRQYDPGEAAKMSGGAPGGKYQSPSTRQIPSAIAEQSGQAAGMVLPFGGMTAKGLGAVKTPVAPMNRQDQMEEVGRALKPVPVDLFSPTNIRTAGMSQDRAKERIEGKKELIDRRAFHRRMQAKTKAEVAAADAMWDAMNAEQRRAANIQGKKSLGQLATTPIEKPLATEPHPGLKKEPISSLPPVKSVPTPTIKPSVRRGEVFTRKKEAAARKSLSPDEFRRRAAKMRAQGIIFESDGEQWPEMEI